MATRLHISILLTIIALVAPSGAFAQQNEHRIALLIGNAAYPDAEAPLKDPLSDVRSFAEELRRDNFEVDIGENLTKETMRVALDRFYSKIKSGSAALLFFSGYGIQSARQTYVVPVNAQIWSEAEVRRDGYSLDSILAEMNTKGARVKIAILDASRRNPFERRFRSFSAGLAPVTVPKGTLVMYSTAPSTVVSDNVGGLFVSEMLKEIRVPGLTVEDVFNRTRMGVSRASQGEQVPWFSSSLGEEWSFGTVRKPAPVAPPVGQSTALSLPSDRPATPRPPPADTDADARRDFDYAERVGSPQAYEDYLYKYPSGPYSDRARDQLQRLQQPRRPTDAAVTTPVPPPVAPPRPVVPDRPAVQDNPPVVASRPPPAIEDQVIQDLDRQIQADPNNAAAYYRRGQRYARNGDFGRAVRDFDEALRLNPRDAEALNNRCWARAIVGDLQSALKDCNEALKLRPRYVDALDSRGFVNLKVGLPSSAIADYDAALKINPRQASSLYGRGIAKRRNGNTSGGNGDIEAAKAIQSDIAEEFASYGIR